MAAIVAYAEDADAAQEARELQRRYAATVAALESRATERVAQKQHIEKRWLEDLRLFHGRYEDAVARELRENRLSGLFMNLVRVKTNAMAARLSDMLFPTDEKNWSIGPTPVPSLEAAAEAASRAALEAESAAREAEEQGAPGAPQLSAEAQERRRVAAEFRHVTEEADRRAAAMEREIEDQLEECGWPAQCRDAITDGVKLGCGVIKGPVTGDPIRKGWRKSEDPEDGGAYRLEYAGEEQASYRRVDPWSFFPDLSVQKLGDGDGVFERHLLSKRQLRALGRAPGFSPDAVRTLLKRTPSYNVPGYLAELRNMGADHQQITSDVYCVWEYSGPLAAEELETLYAHSGDDEGLQALGEVDPLDEVHVVLWFCDGEVLKVSEHPLDSNECLYSVFALEPDEATPLGKGMPYLMRDPQSAHNAAWRMLMDNAGAGVGPQIVVNKSAVEPADGDWTPRSFKVWHLTEEGLRSQTPPFQQYKFDMAINELIALIELTKGAIDDVSALNAITQGEQGAGTTQTAQGMALLMSSSNIVFKASVKHWDDEITVPCLRRAYDWNMQISPKEEIKGDMRVAARGASVLLVRELQAQNLVAIGDRYAGHPVFGAMLRKQGLPLLREIIIASQLPVDDIVLTEDEWEDEMAKMAAAPDAEAEAREQDRALREMELEMKAEIANLDASTRMKVAETQHATAMMKLAEQLNMSEAQIRAMMRKSAMEVERADRALAAEIAMSEREQERAAAEGQRPIGSGGLIA